ncbi:hypothetical protein SAMN05443579_11583 [Variovorax sp. PDC80]|uniref:hypothetical protein n=1 Tax=Variovorax sp. PDC80 TaxID=1882827 RepID=UPI0008F2A8F6|nr:hypothetical protein [Variovorax sp. PDC80]SFP77716.1 hypothetical protein SAMN05443579_11583 [Variovorax sp. PDC80]
MADAAHGTEHDSPPTPDDTPANQLRRISVHVIEPGPGRYFWVLLEQGDDPLTWRELLASQRPCRHWNHALTDGMAALMDLAGDVREGPREIGATRRSFARMPEASLRNW